MRTLASIVAALLLVGGFAAAQGNADTQHVYPDMRGEWKLGSNYSDLRFYALSPTETRDYRQQLEALEAVLHATGVVNPPMGFEARAQMRPWREDNECEPSPCRDHPVKTEFTIWFCPFYTEGVDKTVGVAVNGAPSILLSFNSLDRTIGSSQNLSYEGIDDLDGARIYLKPEKTGEIAGFPVFESNTMLITNSRTPYWIPVSREQYLRAAMRAEELQVAKARTGLAAAGDPYRDWMKGKTQLRADRERLYADMKKTDPKAADEMRRAAEEAEAAMEQGLKESTAALAALAQGASDPFQSLEDALTSLRSELASLSPDERKSDAWYSGRDEGRHSHLTDAGAPDARPLIKTNPGFLDRARPRTAFQLAAVQFSWAGYHGTHSARPEDYANEDISSAIALARMSQMAQTTDWRKVAGLLTPAAR